MIFSIVKNFIAGNILTILGWGAAALAVLAILAGAKRAGRLAERADNLHEAAQVTHEQIKAALGRPRTRDDLVGRMRDGTF